MEMVPFILSCITCFAARLCTGNLPGGLCSYLGVTEWSDPVLRSSNLFKKKKLKFTSPIIVARCSTGPEYKTTTAADSIGQASKQATKQAALYTMRIEQEHAENDRNLPSSRVTHQQQATEETREIEGTQEDLWFRQTFRRLPPAEFRKGIAAEPATARVCRRRNPKWRRRGGRGLVFR